MDNLDRFNEPNIVIIGLGQTGANIAFRLLEDVPQLKSQIINDNEPISVDIENNINEFISNSDTIFIIGSINDNTKDILCALSNIIDKDCFTTVLLTTTFESKDIKKIKSTFPNTIIAGNYAVTGIYKIMISIITTLCYQTLNSRYLGYPDITIYDIANSLSFGKEHYVGWGVGIGIDGTRDSMLQAFSNFHRNIGIESIKSILFLFKLPMHVGLYSIEDAIEMFKKKYNYDKDFKFICICDTKSVNEEFETIMIATTD